jgi:hypothetical protein
MTEPERQVAFAKEHLLARIEHLRREAAYDYPPAVLKRGIADVRDAARAYYVAWDERAGHTRGELAQTEMAP